MRFLILTVTFAVCSMCVLAQPAAGGSQFDAAAEAFESGDYQQTISLLAAYEKSHGTSPRLESLRALAYRDLDKPKEAHQAILVYLRLTARRDMSGSTAHQDMLKLRDEMRESIEKDHKEKKEKLDEEREEVAREVVEQLEAIYRSPEIRISSSTSVPASIKKTLENDTPGEYIGPPESAPKPAGPGMDALAELEMWRKINQSTIATDYFLFIESFPNGQFTEIARKKMLEIGDPVWNQVRDTHDPFKFRDFIKANPDSPFLEIAKARMQNLAEVAIEWEQIKVGKDQYMLKGFEVRNPGHPLAAEAKDFRSAIVWKQIENSNSAARYEEYIAEFPNSRTAVDARAALERLKGPVPAVPVTSTLATTSSTSRPPGLIFSMPVAHLHGPAVSVPALGDLTFDGRTISYSERSQLGLSEPVSGHSFTLQCSDLKSVKYALSTLTIRTHSGAEKSLIPTLATLSEKDAIEAKVRLLKEACGTLSGRADAVNGAAPVTSPKSGVAITLLHIHPGTFSNKALVANLVFDGVRLSVEERSADNTVNTDPKHTYSLGCSEIKILINHFDYLLIGPKTSAKAYAPSLAGDQQKPEMIAFRDKVRAECNLQTD